MNPPLPVPHHSPGIPSAAVSAMALAGCLLLTFAAPAVGTLTGMPGDWYASLDKPAWNPPDWIFGPVWTMLHTAMAVAAWLVWRKGGWRAQAKPLALYLVQLALNAAWTPLFFGLRAPGLAFAEIVLMLLAILATMRAFFPVNRAAGFLFLPYALWVAFATFLNFTLWRMNPA